MPITPHATIGPREQVWSFGWLVNRLLERRPSAIAVPGTWLISFPFVLPALAALMALALLTPAEDLIYTLIAAIPTMLFATCCAILAVRVTRAYYRGHPDASGSREPAP